jgi:RNA polymerase sigma-70 factor (ECF subfamily)
MLKQRFENDNRTVPQTQARADPSELVEQRLMGQIATKHLLAFEALYRCYYPRLTRFLDRMTRRPSLVEEILNDTMFVVWNRADSYNGQCKVSTWIFAIAYRKALKALQRLDEPAEDEDPDLQMSDEPGPEQLLGQQQMNELLSGALDSLSAEHRAVVDLTYFHGADYREIAQIVDCPIATVKTRMFHARRRLKVLLAGRMEDWL